MHFMSRSETSLQLTLVLIPKSIPTKLSILGNTSDKAKLLLQNLENIHMLNLWLGVTDDGIAVSSLENTIFSFPILAYEAISWPTWNPPFVNLAVGNDILLLNLEILIGLPFLLPGVDLKKIV